MGAGSAGPRPAGGLACDRGGPQAERMQGDLALLGAARVPVCLKDVPVGRAARDATWDQVGRARA